jgi:hypothetical protein
MQQTERSFETKSKFFFRLEYLECQLRYMALDRCSLILFYFCDIHCSFILKSNKKKSVAFVVL